MLGRLTTLIVAGAVVALPAQALSSGERGSVGSTAKAAGAAAAVAGPAAKARGGNDVTVGFSFTTKAGKPNRVFDFSYQGAPISCDQGDTTTSGSGFGSMKVKGSGKFRRTFNADNGGGSTGTVKIRGKFLGGKRWEGTLRSQGDFDGGTLTNCDTGRLDWKARTT
jgi:hypothetical protein